MTIRILATLLALDDVSHAQVGRLYPVDESGRDTTLSIFRDQLITALTNNDTTFLWQAVDSNITNGFIDLKGISSFKESIRNPSNTLRNDLLKALKLGGTLSADGTLYHAPYTNVQFSSPTGGFEFGIIIGDKVNVRMGPSSKSRVLRQLSYNIVRVADWLPQRDFDGSGWIKVELNDSISGFVAQQFIVSPIECRVFLTKENDRWQISGWAAGD